MPPDDKKTNTIYGILVSGFMSFTLSGLFSLTALGFGTEWLRAWAGGFAVAWPLSHSSSSPSLPQDFTDWPPTSPPDTTKPPTAWC